MDGHRTPARWALSRSGIAIAAIVLASPLAAQQATEQQAPSAAAPTLGLGIDTANMDRSVRPQDDINEFVNGTWLKSAEIPADRSSWGSFVELTEKSDSALRLIVDDVAARTNAPAGSEERKIGDFYRSYMDTARIESLDTKPLQPELDAIAGIGSVADLPAAFARAQRVGVQIPFGAFVGQDQKNSSAYVVSITQSGLGMPDRDYYLRDDAKFAGIRKSYVDYITSLMTLAGRPDPAGAAQRIMALETKIAEKHWERAKLRDRDKTYNKMRVAEVDALTPSFDWPTYLKAARMGEAEDVVVRQPDYLQALEPILRGTPASTWKEYLTYKLLSSYADELPSDFERARFDFYGRTLSGLQEMRSREKRGVAEVEGAMGEALGKLYVQRYFKPEAKARMDALVKNLLAAFRQGIEELDWMSPATKAQAQDKLAHFTVKIGYPDKWRDYSTLEIRPGDLVGNVMRAQMWRYDDRAGRLGEPVDRTEWGMTPQTVNAYYNPTNNEIVFPAAILQPPFFNVEADDAVNYGGIGAVIGHEISHGFDDQGRKSDGMGNLRDWWTAADAQAFQARTDKLDAEYSAYVPIDSLHINGKLTMGENIGDLSGLAVALRAYHMSLNGKPAPVIDGFTGDQRFFMGWVQVWRTKMRDEALRQQLLTNPHSPGSYRAFVPLTNIQAFYDAFDVKQGDEMWRPPEERVRIW